MQQQYKEFLESLVGLDILSYIRECIELNRDLLEGIQKLENPESDEKLRGRNAQCRDFISYILTKAEEDSDS